MPLTEPATTPYFKTEDFAFPDWYEKSAKQTKRTWLGNQINQQLADYGNEAYRLRDLEESRGAAQEAYAREAKAKADKPTITNEEIDRRFARSSDNASQGFLDDMAGIREYAGESGVGGGAIQGIAANAELERLAQLTQARGDLMSFKATQDALDRQREFDRATQVGQIINRPVSMLGVDFQNQALQTRQAMLGVEVNRQGADKQAEATKNAGLLGAIGSIGGGILGAL
jgi:hypothetical protein